MSTASGIETSTTESIPATTEPMKLIPLAGKGSFRDLVPLNIRRAIALKNQERFKGKCITCVLEAYGDAPALPPRQRVFIMPANQPFGCLTSSVRRRLEENNGGAQNKPLLTSQQALFYFINNAMPCTSAMMGQHVRTAGLDEDGLLYVQYGFENTFG